jgi:hypothetical protein
MGGYFLVGGGFQDVEGSPLSHGWLTAQLTAPATDTTTTIGICNTEQIEFTLDANGNITAAPAQYIWPTNILENFTGYTFSYYYRFTGYSSDGALAWGPNYLPITSVSATDFVNSELFVGNGEQQVYVLSSPPVANSLFVYYNGVLETNYTYNLIDNTVTFTFVPDINSHIALFYYFDQTVSPVFITETPTRIGTNLFLLSETPINGTLLLYSADIDEGGLFLTIDVDYTLQGSTITLLDTYAGTLLATYQTGTGYTTSVQVTPNGVLNGYNLIFALPSVAIPQSIQLFWNGLEQSVGVDYALSSDNMTITMVQAPSTGDTLTAFYNLDAIAIDFNTFTPVNPA